MFNLTPKQRENTAKGLSLALWSFLLKIPLKEFWFKLLVRSVRNGLIRFAEKSREELIEEILQLEKENEELNKEAQRKRRNWSPQKRTQVCPSSCKKKAAGEAGAKAGSYRHYAQTARDRWPGGGANLKWMSWLSRYLEHLARCDRTHPGRPSSCPYRSHLV